MAARKRGRGTVSESARKRRAAFRQQMRRRMRDVGTSAGAIGVWVAQSLRRFYLRRNTNVNLGEMSALASEGIEMSLAVHVPVDAGRRARLLVNIGMRGRLAMKDWARISWKAGECVEMLEYVKHAVERLPVTPRFPREERAQLSEHYAHEIRNLRVLPANTIYEAFPAREVLEWLNKDLENILGEHTRAYSLECQSAIEAYREEITRDSVIP